MRRNYESAAHGASASREPMGAVRRLGADGRLIKDVAVFRESLPLVGTGAGCNAPTRWPVNRPLVMRLYGVWASWRLTADWPGAILEMALRGRGTERNDPKAGPIASATPPPSAGPAQLQPLPNPQGQNRALHLPPDRRGAACLGNGRQRKRGIAALLHECHRRTPGQNLRQASRAPSGWRWPHRARLAPTPSGGLSGENQGALAAAQKRAIHWLPLSGKARELASGDGSEQRRHNARDMVLDARRVQTAGNSFKAGLDGSAGICCACTRPSATALPGAAPAELAEDSVREILASEAYLAADGPTGMRPGWCGGGLR